MICWYVTYINCTTVHLTVTNYDDTNPSHLSCNNIARNLHSCNVTQSNHSTNNTKRDYTPRGLYQEVIYKIQKSCNIQQMKHSQSFSFSSHCGFTAADNPCLYSSQWNTYVRCEQSYYKRQSIICVRRQVIYGGNVITEAVIKPLSLSCRPAECRQHLHKMKSHYCFRLWLQKTTSMISHLALQSEKTYTVSPLYNVSCKVAQAMRKTMWHTWLLQHTVGYPQQICALT